MILSRVDFHTDFDEFKTKIDSKNRGLSLGILAREQNKKRKKCLKLKHRFQRRAQNKHRFQRRVQNKHRFRDLVQRGLCRGGRYTQQIRTSNHRVSQDSLETPKMLLGENTRGGKISSGN